MRFSVIIPTFKRAQLLGDAIRAALAQSHPNREILIVDDGSPDDTRNVASTFGDAVRYFRQENKGKSAALNLGISASTGDAIIVLDDDDLFPPWTVAKHAEALERNAAADFFFGQRRLLVVIVGIASVESLNRGFVSHTQNESTPGGSYPHHEIRVPCRRFRSLLEEFEVIQGVIQGNEFLCVEGLDPYQLPRPSYVL